MRTRQGLVAMLGIGVALAVQAWVPGGVGPEVEARSAAPVVPLSLPKLRHVRAVPVADVPLEVVSAEPVDDLLMSRALHDDDAVLGVLHGHVVGPDGQSPGPSTRGAPTTPAAIGSRCLWGGCGSRRRGGTASWRCAATM